MENWKTIPGYENYEVSDYGNIRSLNYKRTGTIRLLKPAVSRDGYLKTMIKRDDGKYTTISIHRVIARVFIGTKLGVEVNHKNGIKTDNRLENIELITHSQNCQHSFDTGLQKPKRGELNGMAKLTQSKADELRERKRTGGRFWGRNELAKELGVTPKHLQRIVNKTGNW